MSNLRLSDAKLYEENDQTEDVMRLPEKNDHAVVDALRLSDGKINKKNDHSVEGSKY